jgi:hypothetical protein
MQQGFGSPLAGQNRKLQGPYVVSRGVFVGILHKAFQTSGFALRAAIRTVSNLGHDRRGRLINDIKHPAF